MATRTVSNAGGNWNATATWVGGVVPIAGDDINFTATSGDLTVNVSTANLVGVNFTNYVGTITFNNTINTNGVLNLGTGGYTQAGASGILLNGTATLTSGGVTWSRNLIFGGASPTYTLVGNWTVTGAMAFQGSGTTTLTNNTLNINGGLTQTTAGTYAGTTAIVFGDTGTWSNSSTGVLRNNTTVNIAGTLTISGTVRYNTGTLTYIAGTVDTTGSTLSIGANTTLNTDGITWNNITTTSATLAITLGSNLTLTGTLTVGTGTTSFVLGGFSLVSTNANLTMSASATFTMPANQTFKTLTVSGTAIITSNTLTITENLTINAAVSGTTSIIYGGTGTWSALNTNSLISNILTINTPTGTLTISGTVYKQAGLFTYTAGTIDDTTGTVAVAQLTLNLSLFTFRKLLVNGAITLTSNLNATTFGTWGTNNTSFVLGGNSLNFTHLELGNTASTTLPTAWTAQNVELVATSSSVMTANSITITGNLTQSGAGAYSGTTTFTYNVPALSTGTWSRTGIGRLQNNFTINSAGTIDFTGGIIGGGIFTYTAGTFNCQIGSILYNGTSGTTFNGAGITWYNVVFGAVSGIASVSTAILNTQLICIGTLTLQSSTTTFSGTDGTFDTYDFVLGSDGIARSTTLLSTKTYRVRQLFTATQPTNAAIVTLRSSIAASQAIFTLDNGATIDVGFVNATDINSSLGRPIYSYKGVFSNTLNWGLLPTDNTRSGRSTFVG
jgi:hypothetical protein